MRRSWALLLIILLTITILLAGCIPAPQLTVKLASPVNNSAVFSLSPMMVWGGGGNGATYRLLLAADANFQNLVIDASNLGDPRYTVPSGKLNGDSTYYWKVIATKGAQTSDWSPTWSFQTPSGDGPGKRGIIRVSATVDGTPWSGSVTYAINGPFSDTDNSLPWNFSDVPPGTYTITYNYGGPQGATLASITPSPSQDLPSGGTINFILNFHTQSTSSIMVNATLNGAPWSGPVSYSISGPFNDADTIVPQTVSNLPAGAYTLTYSSGGPSGAILSSITPATTQTLTKGGSIVYTLNFSTGSTSSLSVTATLNGTSWSGQVRYSISGASTFSRNDVPFTLNNASPGNYTILYQSGGPPGATLVSIYPAATITLASGRSAGFVLNFSTKQTTGNVVVNATLNGSSWSGAVNYFLSGPFQISDSMVPRTYSNVPTGTYSISYAGGGPSGATLASITPAPSQNLASGRTVIFNMNFVAQPSTGTITVSALLDGQPWQVAIGSGSISYTLTGPKTDSSSTVPATFSSMPAGPYTLNYNSGGPIGATLTGISPAPSQNLSPGGAIAFTLNFTGQPKGQVSVAVTFEGQPWSGEIGYVVGGPYTESGSSAPRTFSNAPAGSYSLQYSSGGPPGGVFEGVSPSSQMLPAGGTIMFNIMFKLAPGPEPGPMPGPIPRPPEPGPMPGPIPRPEPEPGPMPGPIPEPEPEPEPPIPGPLK